MSQVDNNYGVSHGLNMIYITFQKSKSNSTVWASEPVLRMIFIEQLLIVFSN